MTWHIIGILVFVVIYNIWRYYHEDDSDDYGPNIEPETKYIEVNATYMEETIITRQLALRTIENIGSEPKYDEAGRIQFEYQGVVFVMEADNECLFVNLIWPWCHSFSKFDIDEFARVRQVVNEVNLHESVSVVYTISDSDDVALHIKKHFLLVPQIPDVEEYLRMIIKSFFRVDRTLELEIEKCRTQECEQHV